MTRITSRRIFGSAALANLSWGQRVLWALGFIFAIRLVSLYYNTTDLFFDEAQYWLWGKEPDFGYFSKPPILGWIIAIFTGICGDTEFCVRLPSPFFHTGTALLIYLSANRLFDARTGFWSALTFALLPGITLSSTLISTDVPLLFFWAASLWAFLAFKDEPNWRNTILLGVAIGVGLMAKYAMAYFFLSVVLLALFEPSTRHLIFNRKFGVSILVSCLVLSPNIIWNMQHQFITASHTGDNIGWRGGLHPLKALEFVGSQFGVFGPILFAFFLIALVRFMFEGWDNRQKLLVLFSAPVPGLVTFQALMSKAYANWAAVTYVAASILIADILVNRVPPLWNKINISIHSVIFAGLSIAVAYSAPGILTLANGHEPFERLHGWHDLALASEKKLDEGDYVGVIGPHRHLTAELVYYLRHRSQKVFAMKPEGTPQDHYQLTRPYEGQPEGALLLVSASPSVGQYAAAFAMIIPRGSTEFTSGKIRKLWFFELNNYGG